jgi:hypothetical protein
MTAFEVAIPKVGSFSSCANVTMAWKNQPRELSSTSTVYALILTSNYDFFFWRTIMVGLENVIHYNFPNQPQLDLNLDADDNRNSAAVKLGVKKTSIDAWNGTPVQRRRCHLWIRTSLELPIDWVNYTIERKELSWGLINVRDTNVRDSDKIMHYSRSLVGKRPLHRLVSQSAVWGLSYFH